MYIGVHVKYVSGFDDTQIFKFPDNQSNGSWNFSMQINMAKPVVALQNFANVPTGE